MIKDVVIQRAICDKCGFEWNLRNVIPRTCGRCKCRTWNGSVTDSVKVVTESVKPDVSEPVKVVTESVSIPVTESVRTFTQPVTNPIDEEYPNAIDVDNHVLIVDPDSYRVTEPVSDIWQGWSDERSTLDDTAGETVYYREHLKTRKRRETRREAYYG